MALSLPITFTDPFQPSNLATADRDYEAEVGGASDVYAENPIGYGSEDFVASAVSTHGDRGGAVQRSFVEDWYYRIHFIPAQLDLGNLLSEQARTVTLWNAYFETRTMTSFTPPDSDGVAVVEPVSAPYAFLPLELLNYEFSFSTDGPPVLSGSAEWAISGISYDVPITGRRVIVWPFPPSWDQRVDESLEWLTAVDRSYDGTEQRAALRERPRRNFEYAVRRTQQDAQYLETLLTGWSARPFALPVWMERSRITAPAAAGATTISCDTADRGFVAGGLAVILVDRNTLETVEIDSVGGSSLTLARPLLNAWAAGTNIFPATISRLDQSVSVNRLTDSALETPVRFLGVPGESDPRIPSSPAEATYRGQELYLRGTNWAGGVSFDYQADFTLVDSGGGTVSVQRRADFPTVFKRHAWVLRNAADITTFRAWLGRRRGQAVPVWMPTGTNDFTLVSQVLASSDVLVMRGNGFERYGTGFPERSHVLIRLRDGTYFAREITGASAGGGDTVNVTIDTPLGAVVNPEDVKLVSFLGLWRLASDAVVIGYETDSVAVVEATMRLTKP